MDFSLLACVLRARCLLAFHAGSGRGWYALDAVLYVLDREMHGAFFEMVFHLFDLLVWHQRSP